MTAEVEGMAELKRNLAKLEINFGKEIKSALIFGGLLVETQAKQNIQEVNPGKQVTRYRNSGTKKAHIAAGAGESPNTDTGNLIRSITTEVKEESVFVGTSVKYAEALEFGTINMKPRPFLHKALLAKQSKINKLFIKAAKDAINASTN
tara:strand:+ start:3646 stop:4092 length:447 start_codon:yes stop_codon:yes gene_type:complete